MFGDALSRVNSALTFSRYVHAAQISYRHVTSHMHRAPVARLAVLRLSKLARFGSPPWAVIEASAPPSQPAHKHMYSYRHAVVVITSYVANPVPPGILLQPLLGLQLYALPFLYNLHPVLAGLPESFPLLLFLLLSIPPQGQAAVSFSSTPVTPHKINISPHHGAPRTQREIRQL